MRVHRFLLAVVLAALTAVAARTGEQPAKEKDADAELEKQVKALREQIEDLRKKQADLEKALVAKQRALADEREERTRKAEAERKAKEEAEKKKQYNRVEIRGTLSKAPEIVRQGHAPRTAWTVTAGNVKWALNLSGKKELQADVTKLVGKAVIVAGPVIPVPTTPVPNNPYQPWPNPDGNPWEPWILPTVQPNTQTPFVMPANINVESIREPKD
jgi:hypothetical protein